MIKIGIIGCGRVIEEGHLPGIREAGKRIKVAALADVTSSNLNHIGDSLGVDKNSRYRDYRELLKAERTKVDVIVLALPHALHKSALITAAKAGYAILTEKPLAVNLTESKAIFRVLRQCKTYFGIVHNYWRTPEVFTLKTAVRDKIIGNPFLFRIEKILGGYWPGTQAYRSSWRSEAKLGGRGCLLDNGYHWIYSAEHIMGSPVQSIYARAECYNRNYTVEDTALVLLRHKNGATTSLQIAWSVSAGGQVVTEVHGTLGSISRTRTDVAPFAYYNNKTREWRKLSEVKSKFSPFGQIYNDFITAFESGKSYVDNYAAAWSNMAILEAAYRSVRTRREEKVHR